MPERQVADRFGDPVAMAALNECLEAWMQAAGAKGSRDFLRCLAARMATKSTVVPIRGQPDTSLAARTWLQARLPEWLSRHG